MICKPAMLTIANKVSATISSTIDNPASMRLTVRLILPMRWLPLSCFFMRSAPQGNGVNIY